MTSAAPLVRVSTAGAVTTLELDSPHNRNALSTRLMAELARGLADAAADPAVRAVVLGHTGKVFCAGADLSEATGSDPTVGPRGLVDIQRAIVDCPKPVIAYVNGHVRAGGLGLLGAADLAIAGPAATFAFTEVRLGLAPAVISLPLRPKLEPRAAARYYLTGETFDAVEAARIGLITAAAARRTRRRRCWPRCWPRCGWPPRRGWPSPSGWSTPRWCAPSSRTRTPGSSSPPDSSARPRRRRA